MQPLMDLDLIAMLNAIADEHEETVRTFARRWVAQLVRPPRFPRLVPII